MIDKNNDKLISTEEMDLNHDGILDTGERALGAALAEQTVRVNRKRTEKRNYLFTVLFGLLLILLLVLLFFLIF